MAPWEFKQEPEDKLSLPLKSLAFPGLLLEDSEDVSLSTRESQQIFAGICPYVQPHQIHFPLGQFWHDCCFLLGAGAEDGWGARADHHSHPPLPLPRSLCWGRRWCQLTFQTYHASLGFIN